MDPELKGKISVDEVKRAVDPDPEVRALREENKKLRKRLRTYKVDEGKILELMNEIKANMDVIEPMPSEYKVTRGKKVDSPCEVVWHLTDWHIGEVIEKDEIEGLNEFNLSIAKKRVGGFLDKTMKWTEIHRSSYEIPTLRVICTGDFISGDIHEELRRTNEFPVPIQAIEAGSLLAELVAGAAPHFPAVVVDFIVPDNHSRLTHKFQFKQGGFNSLNYIVGWIAKERLSQLKNVKFNMYPGSSTVVNVRGFKYLCSHGGDVKGWAGVPYYGIERKTGKEAVKRMNMPDDKRFKKVLIGHFHEPLSGRRWTVGGSLSGTSELDHSQGRFSPPGQTTWLVHPKHGEFDFVAFWL